MNRDSMYKKLPGQLFSVFFGSKKAALISSLFCSAMGVLLSIVLLQVQEAAHIELPTGQTTGISAKASPAHSMPSGEILVLNSYHTGLAWSDNEMAGISEVLLKMAPGITFSVEYLDCKRYPKLEHFEQVKNLFKLKYGNRVIPVVIVADNPALDFAVKYRSELFPASAIIFCGVNSFKKDMLGGQENITGFAEALNAVDTVSLALKIHPKAKTVVVVHDYTSTGLATRREAEEQLKGKFSGVTFRYLEDMTKNELTQLLRGLPEDTLVLALAYNVFKDGEVSGHENMATLLGANSSAPVYGVHQERLGYGIVGGSLLSGKLHGADAGRLALKILAGTHAADIPVLMKPPTRVMFDYNQLAHFGIPVKVLPEGSVVVNRPIPFISSHPQLVISTLLVIALLASGIIILGFNIRLRQQVEDDLRCAKEELAIRVSERTAELKQANEQLEVELTERKLAEALLKEGEARLKEAQQIAHLGHWDLDLEKNLLYWSDEVYRLFGLEPQEFSATYEAFLEHVHPDDRDFVNSAYSESVNNRKGYDIEHRILLKSAEVRYVNERCITEYDETGKALRSLGTVLDITERKRAEEALQLQTVKLEAEVARRQKAQDELEMLNKELEQRVQERTAELKEKYTELERLNKLFVGRELRMAELKVRIRELEGGR